MVNSMKIWINKCIADERTLDFFDSLTFNVSVPGQGGVLSSNIRNGWFRLLGVQETTPICEDLFIIALSVFAADKRIPRNKAPDGWTRTLHLNIPVLREEQWNSVSDDLEKTLSYLSGDIWKFSFRQASVTNRYIDTHKREPIINCLLEQVECVSLFSGGLDSFCGAYDLLRTGKNTIFVGFKEYGKLEKIQRSLMDDLDRNFPDVRKMLFSFTAKAYSPICEQPLQPENTSRSRSFLFICAAISIAEIIGNGVPVYIPENGFIGLNLPLTEGRNGSCSTRTTHPYFLRMLNNILEKIGIQHRVINPFAFSTKREMVHAYLDCPGFVENIHKTISCSHPCNNRWYGGTMPENCGYCYPCLIRQSSLINIDVPHEYYGNNPLSLHYIMNASNAKRSDLVDLLTSVNKAINSTDETLYQRIRLTGRLSQEEILAFLRLYKETIRDIIQMISIDPELMRLVGLAHETD